MFFLQGLMSGIIATIIFDLFQQALRYSYNINKTRWDLVGRYFYGLKNKIYLREYIQGDEEVKNETIIGYFFHYLIGSVFGVFYVSINLIFYNSPSILISILVGFITVLGSWCIMMPFAFNIGFFASKKTEQKQIMAQNLIAHFIFGIGLFIGYNLIS